MHFCTCPQSEVNYFPGFGLHYLETPGGPKAQAARPLSLLARLPPAGSQHRQDCAPCLSGVAGQPPRLSPASRTVLHQLQRARRKPWTASLPPQVVGSTSATSKVTPTSGSLRGAELRNLTSTSHKQGTLGGSVRASSLSCSEH